MADNFSITVSDSDADRVELVLTGEIDVASAPTLADALDALSRVGATFVTVDAAAVTFIDSTGLRALVRADGVLRARGGRLHLADPSPAVRRLVELSGLGDDLAAPPTSLLRSDVEVGTPLVEQLRGIIGDIAGIVLTASSLQDDLDRVIRFGCHVLPRCSAASIALLVDGRPTTVAVSEHVALELDIAQYETDEGPCLAALDGERIRVDIVDADERFPHFALGAADHRVNSVLSMPIVHRDDVVGTLNFYSRQPAAFDDAADHIARVVGGQAAQAITRSDVLSAARERRDQLQAHYDEAALAARAQGILVATQHCSVEQARNLIRHAAADTGDSPLTIAERILAAARHGVS
jgi:anti-anti-sigma factor